MHIRNRLLSAGVLLPGAVIAAIVAADLLIGPNVSLIAVLVTAPLVASLICPPGVTAAVSLVAVLVAVALGVPNEFFGEPDHLTRILPVLVSGLLSTWAAWLRRSRESVAADRAALLESEHAARLNAERMQRSNAETAVLLDTLLERAPAGFAYLDPDLRYVRVNDALAAMIGLPRERIVGRRVAELGADLNRPSSGRAEVMSILRRVASTGESVVDREISGEPRVPSRHQRHWLTSYYPVKGPTDEVIGVGLVAIEITDRKRAEARANFLAEVTAALNASLDYEMTLTNVARLTVPELADWCVVDMVEPDGRLRRLAITHEDPHKEELVWDLERRYPTDPEQGTGAALTVATGESQLMSEIDDALLARSARSEEHLRLMREIGLRSAMVVPLTAGGRTVGAVSFVAAESQHVFDAGDLELAEELGRRAGEAIENARLYEERSHIARTLQRSLLPPHLPEIPGVEVAARYRAAGEASDVGGDFYDVFPTGPNTWAMVVGDVLGKGASAAAMIGLARHTLRAAAMRERDPIGILATLNDALYREGADESFCTAVFGSVQVADEPLAVELTSAGHPLPLVLRGNGAVESAGVPGTLLGAVPALDLRPTRLSLAPGDALVAFTDGVLEARSPEGMFGEHRLERLLESLPGASAREMAERVERDAVEFQGGRPRDDLAVLVLRRPVAGGSNAAPAETPLGATK